MPQQIRWFEPRFDDEEIKEVEKVIRDNYVNEGPKTRELEELFRNYFGVKYAVLTVNATAALFLAIKSEAKKRNVKDFEVIIPDMTMIATATAVDWAGGKPVMVDVKKENLTIDTDKVEEKITPLTIAILPVHVLGRSADMDKIKKIAKKYNLIVIEDAAGALGSLNNGKLLGTIGDVGCFSLQSNKIITSGQGGVLLTNDDSLFELIRRYRDFGRLSNKEFFHEEMGYNLKFNDLSAALSVAQFKKLEERKKLLLNQFNYYKKMLEEVNQINFFSLKDGEIPLWIDVIAEKRDELFDFLASNQIYCRKCWPAIHRNKPFNSYGNDSDFPNSSFASDNVIWLPNGPAVSFEDIILICEKIKEFYKK